ncbi:MAG: hypothetical protein QXI16_00995 [Sulfolobaceae archaeon]
MQIQLTGSLYFLEFRWNALNEFWVMDIFNNDEFPIIYGIKIVQDYPLLYQYTVEGLPPGEIICQNIVNAPSNIGRFDMSQKFLLVYYEPQEIEELLSEI